MTSVPDDATQPSPAARRVSRWEWERVLRRVILPQQVKLLALTMATYGDPDGGRIMPGFARLGAVCGMGESTVRRHVATLRAGGLIEREVRGGGVGQRRETVFRLTLPADLLGRFDVLDPEEVSPLSQVSGDQGVLGVSPLTTVSGDRNSAHPGGISAQSGERSSPVGKPVETGDLRSLSEGTPLSNKSVTSANGLYQTTYQNTPTHLGDSSTDRAPARARPAAPDDVAALRAALRERSS